MFHVLFFVTIFTWTFSIVHATKITLVIQIPRPGLADGFCVIGYFGLFCLHSYFVMLGRLARVAFSFIFFVCTCMPCWCSKNTRKVNWRWFSNSIPNIKTRTQFVVKGWLIHNLIWNVYQKNIHLTRQNNGGGWWRQHKQFQQLDKSQYPFLFNIKNSFFIFLIFFFGQHMSCANDKSRI